MSYEALDKKMLEMQDEIISAIQENMRINSVRSEAKPEAPYGEGPKAALVNALELGKKLGFKTGHADNRMGWVEYGDGEEMVAVLGHVDVVPAGEGWEYPAFGAEIHDGYLWGRGCLDDKGPIIGSIFALKAIRDLGLHLDRRIRVLFGSDEECGCSCAEYYVNNNYEMPTIGFTPDGDFPVIYCEKHISNYKVGKKITDRGNIEVEYFGGGTAPNVVTPYCKLVVKGSLKVDPAADVTVTEEDGRTIVEAKGLGAHGSTPELGVNAAVKLLTAVKDNDFGGDFQNMVDFVLNKIGTETNGKSLGAFYEHEETGVTTCNLGVLSYENDELSLTLDFRHPINATPEAMSEAVAASAKEYSMDILKESHMPLLYVPKDSELVTKLMKVYEAETGTVSEPLCIGGGTYAKEFPNMVAFGPIFPGDVNVIHQPNEKVEITKLMKSLQMNAAAMFELAQK